MQITSYSFQHDEFHPKSLNTLLTHFTHILSRFRLSSLPLCCVMNLLTMTILLVIAWLTQLHKNKETFWKFCAKISIFFLSRGWLRKPDVHFTSELGQINQQHSLTRVPDAFSHHSPKLKSQKSVIPLHIPELISFRLSLEINIHNICLHALTWCV